MNKFDEYYDFRLARKSDVYQIMKFISDYWGENHILAKDKFFFEWQYGMEGTDDICFVLAIEKKRGRLDAILGFIPMEPKIKNTDIWGALVKTSPLCEIPMLGTELDKRLYKLTEYRTYHSVGLNKDTSLILAKTIFKRKVGKFKHFYRLNRNVKDFHIAKIDKCYRADYICYKDVECVEISEQAILEKWLNTDTVKRNEYCYKSNWYLLRRYFNHPIYNYRMWGISKGKEKIAILVTRMVTVESSNAIRVIDYIGDVEKIEYMGSVFEKMVTMNHCEYIDFYCGGMSETLMSKAGMICNKQEDGNIIPNYFEPFVQNNVDIYYATSVTKNVLYVRGDADQDRPNYGYY